MICPRPKELEACALGALDEAHAAAVRAHALGCAECAEEMEMIAAEKRLFARRAALPAPPPPPFAEVMERLRRGSPAGRRPARSPRLWAGLAAAAAIAFALSRGARPVPVDDGGSPAIVAEPPRPEAEAAAARAEDDYGACLMGTPATGPEKSDECAVTCGDAEPLPDEVLESRPREGSDP
jgi:anti-sigma factor RsiW